MSTKVSNRVTQMEDAGGFPVAVKRWSKAEPRAVKAKWEQEMLQLVQGPGVPKFIRAFEDADYFYVVTEWISGLTLDKYIEEHGGFLEENEALSIGQSLYQLLLRLHNNSKGCFVYTDLKPSNVIIKGKQVFLVDFESVCSSGRVPVDCDCQTVIMGSRPFTAPEVFTGQIFPPSDYYSLGTLLFYMITGHLWQGEGDLLKEDQTGLRILRLMDMDPARRKAGLKLFAGKDSVRDNAIILPDGAGVVKEELPQVSVSDSQAIFIDSNPRFAVELSYEASMHMNLKIGLFFMDDAYIPLAAGNLGIRCVKLPEHIPVDSSWDEKEEIELLKSTADQWMRQGLLMQPEGFGRLYLGLASPERILSHMDNVGWGRFLHWAAQSFDITVLCGQLERSYAAAFCDMVIMASQSNLWEAKMCRYRRDWFASNEFAVPVRFAAWEYKEGISLPSERYAELVGKDDFLGEIYHDGSRQLSENMGCTPYCFAIPTIIREQYKCIISKIISYMEHKYERSNDSV